jgi:hypothetical protein
MKTKLERIALGLILAPLAPLAGLMSFWWAAYAILPETWIVFSAITGLLAGILTDLFLLKRLLDRRLGLPLWAAVYLFYSVGVFGFFMGVPVINAALAVPAGFVIGGRLAGENANRQKVRKTTQRTAWFTTGILVFICAASAFLALSSPSTASDLEGMLALPFAVSPAMIWGLIISGGAALLAANWGLTVLSVHFTLHFLAS